MPKRDYLLHRRRSFHPRTATADERDRQKAAAADAASWLPAPDVLAAYLVSQGHTASYAAMASVQMRARAARGCPLTLAVIKQLEDEVAR